MYDNSRFLKNRFTFCGVNTNFGQQWAPPAYYHLTPIVSKGKHCTTISPWGQRVNESLPPTLIPISFCRHSLRANVACSSPVREALTSHLTASSAFLSTSCPSSYCFRWWRPKCRWCSAEPLVADTSNSAIDAAETKKHVGWNPCLTHCGPVMPYGDISGNGLLSDSTKPLTEPMLTNHMWDLVAFTWGQFHRKRSRSRALIWV